jgi:hypothetical protein
MLPSTTARQAEAAGQRSAFGKFVGAGAAAIKGIAKGSRCWRSTGRWADEPRHERWLHANGGLTWRAYPTTPRSANGRAGAGGSLRVAQIQPQRDSLGQSLTMAGADLQRASAIVEETNRKQDTIAAEAALNKLQQQRITLEFDPKAGFRNVKRGQGVGQQFVDGYMDRFNEAAGAHRGRAAERTAASAVQAAHADGRAFSTARRCSSTRRARLTASTTPPRSRPSSCWCRPARCSRTTTSCCRPTSCGADGTLEAMAQRKGLPPKRVTEMKARFRDANYSARVQSHLIGVPGVMEANPYGARDDRSRPREDAAGHGAQADARGEHRDPHARQREAHQRRQGAQGSGAGHRGTQGFALSGFKPDDGYKAIRCAQRRREPLSQRRRKTS